MKNDRSTAAQSSPRRYVDKILKGARLLRADEAIQ
jgi:hypothetical protein